jgi:predicted RNase H-like HicB family nuclease
MLTKYIEAVMERATYETLPDGSIHGKIAGFGGVSAQAETLEACRKKLEEALEEWVLVRFANNEPLPALEGIEVPLGEMTCYLNLFEG